MSYQTQQIWTNGRKSGIACVTAVVYDNGAIVASSEAEHITEFQMHKALEREFPGIEFSVSHGRGDGLFMEGNRNEKERSHQIEWRSVTYATATNARRSTVSPTTTVIKRMTGGW